MPKYKITIEYDGTGISGWQRQANSSSIQQFIEEAIEKFSKEKVTVHAAGRTDAGVHALGQVAHFKLTHEYPCSVVQRAINHFLKPNKIVVFDCHIVDDEFNARFSAKKRNYKYVVLNRFSPSVIDENRAWHIRHRLDIVKMQEAATFLIGNYDFTSFRAAHCQAQSPIKTIDGINIYQEEEKIYFTLRASSFLHHMVRNIVGSLVLVGMGKWEPEEMKKIIEAKDRTKAGPKAPAHGLYFTKVEY
jgi:tRNA pseudouridine38-40 synthase